MTLYCAGGTRSALGRQGAARDWATPTWSSLAGGFGRWSESGPPGGGARDPLRRRRDVIAATSSLPEVGEGGQARLSESKVLLIGAGGLGSPAALYLAAAGVGTLGVVDSDVVDLSNLQRQVLHRLASGGPAQDGAATATINALNPDVGGALP